MQISVQLSWLEIATNQPQRLRLSLPIAIGKEATSLPERLDGNQVEQVIFSDRSVSRYHALLIFEQGNVVVIDQNSTNGMLVNGVLIDRSRELRKVLSSGDRLTIGRYEIAIAFDLPSTKQTIITGTSNSSVKPIAAPTILFNPNTGLPQANITQPSLASSSSFPPDFFQLPIVEVQSLHRTGLPVYETTYGAIGEDWEVIFGRTICGFLVWRLTK